MAPKLTTEVTVLDRMSSELHKINNNLNSFSKNIESTFNKFKGAFFATAALTGVGYAIKRTIDTSMALADNFDKMSLALGLSTREVQQWDYALRLNKSSMDAAKNAFKEMGTKIYEAHLGSKEASRYFKIMGVSIYDNNGIYKKILNFIFSQVHNWL